jgi:glycosyltransferase involved in cell wall biosynthesis
MNRPLVSMTVICYKAEKYIREAIAGALAQTYSPLEIIFSDDASPDETYSIIEEAVRDYKGPHRIVLNRNPTNMGIGAHVSKVWFEIAKGDWIIVSAGDDVSLPHRVERIMQEADIRLGALHHSVTGIDEQSRVLPNVENRDSQHEIAPGETFEDLIRRGYWLKGSTMCLNMNMLRRYGPLDKTIVNEDNILGYRAFHYGGVKFIHEPLMLYRVHAESISQHNYESEGMNSYRNRIVQLARSKVSIAQQVEIDNKIFSISEDLLLWNSKQYKHGLIDLYLFDKGKFMPSFFLTFQFYMKLIKKWAFTPYWYLRRSK